MQSIHMLSYIPSGKVRYLCHNYICGIVDRLGKLFYVYIKDFYLDEEEVEIIVGISLKENTILVSKYLDYKPYLINFIPNLNEKTVVQIETRKNSPIFSINKYNLYKHLSPINHNANLTTAFREMKVSCKLVFDDRFLKSTPHHTLELDPEFFSIKQQIPGGIDAYSYKTLLD